MSDTKASPGPVFDPEAIKRATLEPDTVLVFPLDGKDVAIRCALVPTMASMLLELEWAGGEAVSRCPVCGERPEHKRYVPGVEVPGRPGFVFNTAKRETVLGGHVPDCALAAILSELRGTP